MRAFIDPRDDPRPDAQSRPPRITTEPGQLADLHRLCRDGRLYEVERWLRDGRPLQLAEGMPVKRARSTSALEIALASGNHALVLLLLANGYNPNLETRSPLDSALRARRVDVVNLLLEWGADPHTVDLDDLFDTYNSELFARFQDMGVDLTTGHALAAALAYHTSNRPLFGFAKRHRERNPKIQVELNTALAHHASEENEKGVQLCLWAGADPHAPAINLRYWSQLVHDDGDEESDVRFSAVYEVCRRGNAKILKRLHPDPGKDNFDELYQTARSREVIDVLAERALPHNAGAVVQHQLWWVTFDRAPYGGHWRSLDTLRRLFEMGVRWTQSSADEISSFRRCLVKASDGAFVDLMKLLATADYCSPEILQVLARTPAVRERMQKVGFVPLPPDHPKHYSQFRPTRSREVLKKFGVEPPKPPPLPPPPSARIGPCVLTGRKVTVDRSELFERVWSTPVARLAAEWGISGPGLKKVCRRLQVPVPPRGYWAKLKAGHRVSRPKLPSLPAGTPPALQDPR